MIFSSWGCFLYRDSTDRTLNRQPETFDFSERREKIEIFPTADLDRIVNGTADEKSRADRNDLESLSVLTVEPDQFVANIFRVEHFLFPFLSISALYHANLRSQQKSSLQYRKVMVSKYRAKKFFILWHTICW